MKHLYDIGIDPWSVILGVFLGVLASYLLLAFRVVEMSE